MFFLYLLPLCGAMMVSIVLCLYTTAEHCKCGGGTQSLTMFHRNCDNGIYGVLWCAELDTLTQYF